MKLSIRDLMLVTVIVALAVAWWVDRQRMATREEQWRRDAADLRGELQDAGEAVFIPYPGGTRRIPLRSPRP